MPEIFRILCYGDSNTNGGDVTTGNRFADDVRWTGVLQNTLGPDYTVIEEGLNGRTTVLDDPYEPFRNGRDYLRPCLMSHTPLNLVVLMLGTNDLKSRFNVPARDIARGIALLVDDIRQTVPDDVQILIVSPVPFGNTVDPDDMFAAGVGPSHHLAGYYETVAQDTGSHFFDAGKIITLNHTDGIHLNAADHHALGTSLAALIQDI
jgi:lysophospholipase L1-like esterase